MLTDAALWTEINSDTYSALDDQPCADLLNATTGATAGTLSQTAIPQSDFLHTISDLLLAVSQVPSSNAGYATAQAILADWSILSPIVANLNTINPQQPSFQGIFQAVLGIGIITQDQYNAFLNRPASRAEVLFGTGTVVTWWDVARVRNANGRA